MTVNLGSKEHEDRLAAPLANPYLEARREWNERYGDYIAAATWWQRVAVVSLLVAIISVSGVVFLASQSKIVPYVVEVDSVGNALAVRAADQAQSVGQQVIRAQLARWLSDWRLVSIDGKVQKQAIDRVYAMLGLEEAALTVVSEFYQANNPFERAKNGTTVNTEPISVLPLTEKTYEIEWWEITRNLSGQITAKHRYKAALSIRIASPTAEAQILKNPVGIYINQLSWSEQI